MRCFCALTTLSGTSASTCGKPPNRGRHASARHSRVVTRVGFRAQGVGRRAGQARVLGRASRSNWSACSASSSACFAAFCSASVCSYRAPELLLAGLRSLMVIRLVRLPWNLQTPPPVTPGNAHSPKSSQLEEQHTNQRRRLFFVSIIVRVSPTSEGESRMARAGGVTAENGGGNASPSWGGWFLRHPPSPCATKPPTTTKNSEETSQIQEILLGRNKRAREVNPRQHIPPGPR
jgi:hypothetical protein